MNRVKPPSTMISMTASASCSPDWGRAMGWLSTLTAMTRRASRVSSSTGSPLSGDGDPAGRVVGALVVVVVVAAVIVVVAAVIVVVGAVVGAAAVVVVSACPAPPQAGRRRARAVSRARRARLMSGER